MPAPASGSKRAKGTGSVRQRRRGVWQVRWETGRGQNRQYHSATVRGSKTEAEAYLRERLVEREQLQALFGEHGRTKAAKLFVEAHPHRTVQGALYQIDQNLTTKVS